MSDTIWETLRKIAEIATGIIVILIAMNMFFLPVKFTGESFVDGIKPGDRIVLSKELVKRKPLEAGDVVTRKVGRKLVVNRVIAVSGDKVSIKDGEVYINGEKAENVDASKSREFEAIVMNGKVFLFGTLGEFDAHKNDFVEVPVKDITGRVLFKFYPREQMAAY